MVVEVLREDVDVELLNVLLHDDSGHTLYQQTLQSTHYKLPFYAACKSKRLSKTESSDDKRHLPCNHDLANSYMSMTGI